MAVELKNEGAFAVLTLNRSEALNALSTRHSAQVPT